MLIAAFTDTLGHNTENNCKIMLADQPLNERWFVVFSNVQIVVSVVDWKSGTAEKLLSLISVRLVPYTQKLMQLSADSSEKPKKIYYNFVKISV